MTVQDWLGEDNKIGISIWERKYRQDNETFDEWLNRVSNNEPELRQLILDKKFLMGGRVLTNRNVVDGGSLNNCYSSGYCPDDLNGIFEINTILGLTYKAQGGQGVSLSKLRPKGAPVGKRLASDGIIPFIQMFNQTTESIAQGGGRKGALMVSLDIWHKEAESFITLKTDLDKINKANLSLEIDDEFMKAVEEYYKTGEEVTIHIKRRYSGHTVEYDVVPIKLFKLMARTAYDYGEPGCLFTDALRNYHLMEFVDGYDIETTNPCVAGDTLILTDEGYLRIDGLVYKEVNVWNGEEFSKATPEITGYNQTMKRVTFSDGSQLDCTNYHKFFLKDGSKVSAEELKVGDKLMKYKFPVIEKGTNVEDKVAYTQGFYLGDGSSETNRDRLSIYLYGDKIKIKDKLNYVNSNCQTEHNREWLTIPYDTALYNKEFVPSTNYSITSRLNWLAGYMDADGTLQDKGGSISISSINRNVLIQVKYLLNTLGCNATVNVMKEATTKLLPKNDGSGENKLYDCQTCYRLLINATNVKKLIDLGLKTNRIPLIANPSRDGSRYIFITEIKDIENCETVYCFNEPLAHCGVFNGILTGQCGEQPLPKHCCCNLGSLNLSEYILNPYTDLAAFDYEGFKKGIQIALHTMDKLIDENKSKHAVSIQSENSLKYRNVGLGVMGYATALMKLGLDYGRTDALSFTDKVFDFMFREAVFADVALGIKYGAFPEYSPSMWDSEIIKNHFTEEEITKLRIYPFRNCSLLSIAPTGSIGTMVGVSGGIEPEFAVEDTFRKTEALGADTYALGKCTGWREYIQLTGDVNKPKWAVGSADIEFPNRIATQAFIQKHIDTGISSTINLPEDITIDNVEELYYLAWKAKLKGITIFRSGCKRMPILTTTAAVTTIEKPEDLTNVIKFDTIVPVSRKQMSNTYGTTYCKKCACGTVYITINCNEGGEIVECFAHPAKHGVCKANIEGLGRILSVGLRAGVKVDELIDQLKGIQCGACIKTASMGQNIDGLSCPDIISKTLQDFYDINTAEAKGAASHVKTTQPITQTVTIPTKTYALADTNETSCPECGAPVIFTGGCNSCPECGYSRCN